VKIAGITIGGRERRYLESRGNLALPHPGIVKSETLWQV
jgi:hypothetical protein